MPVKKQGKCSRRREGPVVSWEETLILEGLPLQSQEGRFENVKQKEMA